MTSYVVLARNDNGGPWSEVGVVDARSAKEAVQKAYLGKVSDELRPSIAAMVAVPGRSWQPTPIRTEVKTKVVLGEPAPEPTSDA